MLLILLALLLVIVLAGAGFALHVLWIIAAVLLVFWLLGFAFNTGSSRGRSRWW